MKKRKLALVFVLIAALLVSQATAFASERTTQTLRYNEVMAVTDYLNYTNGSLYFAVDVSVSDSDSLDYVIITAEVRTMAGESIATYNKRLAYRAGQFNYSRSMVPDHSGLYYVKYTLKCYKNGSIVDEITKTTHNEYVKIN